MGTEKQLTELLVLHLQGQGLPSPIGLRLTGGTPNHKALARVAGYAWGLSHPQDRDEARARVLEFLEDQESNHMGFGRITECGTSSHFAWWQNAMAALWKLAEREDDQEVLQRTRAWWVREVAVERLCATPGGSVVMPGARTHVVKGNADQRRQRDLGLALILGGGNTTRRIPRDVQAGDPSLDRAGLWILHKLLPKAELRAVAVAPARWPVPLDTLYVQKSAAGHVAWFDEVTGLCPSFYAWADYATGEERQGARPDWSKSRPGGPRPADLPVPEVPGEGARLVVMEGRGQGEGPRSFDGPSGAMKAPEIAKGESGMNTNETLDETGIGFVVHDPEEPLKSERVEEELRSMPDWTFDPDEQALTMDKDLPTPEVAALYTAYLTAFAGRTGLPVSVSVAGGLVIVTLYGPRYGNAKGGLTASVLDFARQIG